MVVELGQALHGPKVQPWPRHELEDDESGFKLKDLPFDDLAREPRRVASDPFLAFSRLESDSPGSIVLDSSEASTPTLEEDEPFEKFSLTEETTTKGPLDISLQPLLQALPDIKRRRYGSDVDGTNTADTGCKKRRLRAQLITSRLSQPFSQPATHILNREGQESGDKRFLKMATTVDMTKRLAYLQSTSLLRYSVVNRLRQRLGVHQRETPAVSNGERASPDVNTTAPWTQESHANCGGAHAGESSTRRGVACGCRVSNPAALPLPASDVAATKDRTLLRIDSVQPAEPRPFMESYDSAEEDSFAFLHPEDWDDSDDDAEQVYSDFGVIFGGGGETAEAETQEEHSYEEYLDELDGISWVTR